jgi:hypothetical protein
MVSEKDRWNQEGLGISPRGLTSELAKSVYVEPLKGALIVDGVKGGPTEQAGEKLHRGAKNAKRDFLKKRKT